MRLSSSHRVLIAIAAASLLVAVIVVISRPASQEAPPQPNIPDSPPPETLAPADDEPPERVISAEPSSRSFTDEAAALNSLPIEGGERARALSALVDRWAAVNPHECVLYFSEFQPEFLRRSLCHRAVALWMKQDRVTAESFTIAQLHTNDSRAEYYLEPVLTHILSAENAVQPVFAFMEKLPQTTPVYAAATPPFVFCLQRDLETATAFARRSPASIRPGWLIMAGGQAAMQLGWTALERLENSGDSSPQELGGAIGMLVRQKTRETLAWLELQPASPSFDCARIEASHYLVEDDPPAAAHVAILITDPAIRTQVLHPVLLRWAARDPAAAETWALASDLPVEDVAPILHRAQPRPMVPFERRMAQIFDTGDKKARRRSQSLVFAEWVRTNSADARRWLESSDLSDDEKKTWAAILPQESPPHED